MELHLVQSKNLLLREVLWNVDFLCKNWEHKLNYMSVLNCPEDKIIVYML